MQELDWLFVPRPMRHAMCSRSGGKRVVTEDAEWGRETQSWCGAVGGRKEEVPLPVVGTLVGVVVVVVVVVCQLRTGRRLTEAQSG